MPTACLQNFLVYSCQSYLIINFLFFEFNWMNLKNKTHNLKLYILSAHQNLHDIFLL